MRLFMAVKEQMKLVLIGATGATGLCFLTQALDRGHHVTALARTPEKLGAHRSRERLTVVQGDVLRGDGALHEAIAGNEAVIIALGGDGLGPQTTRQEGTRRVVEVMREERVRRLLVISSLGAGDSATLSMLGASGLVFVKTVIRHAIADHTAQEKIVIGSDLDWTILRPAGLSSEPLKLRARIDGQGKMSVPRAEVALLGLDLLERDGALQEILPVKGG